MARALAWIKATPTALDPAWRAALWHGAAARLGLALWAAWIWLQGLMPVTAGSFYFTVAPLLDGWQGALLGMWQRWDGIYYQAIAETFYSTERLTAFFPAYPLLGRVVAQLTGLPVLAALLAISACATLISLVLLHRTAADLFSNMAADRAVQSALLFPTAFFLFGVYPQSLVLLWMLLAYDQARRERWLAAGLAGLLAGLTHGTVLPLAAMLAVQAGLALRRSRFGLRWLALPAVAGLPLLGTALFLAWREAMGFPVFNALLVENWERVVSPPWETLWALVQYFPANVGRNWVIVLNTAVLVAAVGAVIWGIRRLPLALNVYQIILLLYLLSNRVTSDPLLSLNRYVLVMFPMYLAFGAIPAGRARRMALFALGVITSLGVSGMFFMWKWIG